MKNEITLNLRVYPVVIEDTRRPGMVEDDAITLDKSQLQAAQIVGQSSTELIYRIYNRQGYKVHEIGKPSKVAVTVDLNKLVEEQVERAKYNDLYGAGGGERVGD